MDELTEFPLAPPAATDTLALLDYLPAPARPKLERLLDAREGAWAISREASRNLDEVRAFQWAREAQARAQVRELTEYANTEETRERIYAPVELAKRETERAQRRYDAASKGSKHWHFVDSAIEWLTQARRNRTRVRAAKLPTVKPSEDHSAAVERIRADLIKQDEAWSAAELAPLPIGVARENLFREIDAIADFGSPSISANRRSGSPIQIEKAFRAPHTNDGNMTSGDYGASFLAWFFQDEIKAKLGSMLENLDRTGALTDEEREDAFGEISAKRLELERLEEAHIVAAEANGLMIPRRVDADPRAILEVSA